MKAEVSINDLFNHSEITRIWRLCEKSGEVATHPAQKRLYNVLLQLLTVTSFGMILTEGATETQLASCYNNQDSENPVSSVSIADLLHQELF